MSNDDDDDDDYVESMAQEHVHDSPIPTKASQMQPRSIIITNRRHDVKLTDQFGGAYLATTEEVVVEEEDAAADETNNKKKNHHKNNNKKPQFTIIVLHEWWGLNDEIKSMADQFASLGGIALALDLYQRQPPAIDVSQARTYMKHAMNHSDDLLNHLQAASHYLEQHYPNMKFAIVGWCFGGHWSLRASLIIPMDCTIIYYGKVITNPTQLMSLKGPLLGIFGSQDKAIHMEHVRSFEMALQQAGKKYEICIFDAEHAFANPSSRLYNHNAAQAAWNKVLEFLQSTLFLS